MILSFEFKIVKNRKWLNESSPNDLFHESQDDRSFLPILFNESVRFGWQIVLNNLPWESKDNILI